MKISLIVAMAENRVIGANNRMPWHLPADLQHFKRITLGKPILMGRKTHESIGKALPGRQNIVLTRDRSYRAEGCTIVHSNETALKATEGEHNELMVIGGAALYRDFLPIAQSVYMTLIHQQFEGDTYFPELDMHTWEEKERSDIKVDLQSGLTFSFIRLEKKRLMNDLQETLTHE